MPDFNGDCENCGKREAIKRCPCSNTDCALWVCKRCAKSVCSGYPHRVPVVPVSDRKPEPPPSMLDVLEVGHDMGYGVVIAQALRIAGENDLSPVYTAADVIGALETAGWVIVKRDRL